MEPIFNKKQNADVIGAGRAQFVWISLAKTGNSTVAQSLATVSLEAVLPSLQLQFPTHSRLIWIKEFKWSNAHSPCLSQLHPKLRSPG